MKRFAHPFAIRLLATLVLLAFATSLFEAKLYAEDGSALDVLRTAQSGKWSDPKTWIGGKVPSTGSRVVILEGHRVLYDVNSDQVIRAINLSGTLHFATDRDTRLNVGLIKIQAGDQYSEEGFDCDAPAHDAHEGHHAKSTSQAALEIGTPDEPLSAKFKAVIRLTYVEGMDKQSCPALVCCGGRLDLHGAPLSRSWVKLGADAKSGSDAITLAEPVTGWNVGDRLIVTATNTHGDARSESNTEERTIVAIDGAVIKLDQNLKHDHRGLGPFRGEVANLSRNIVVESADPEGVRGHTMYHRDSSGSLSYTEFRHLGKPGVLGRYSLHFHLVGDTMRGSSVVGNSIWDSGNRWLTIHGTNYLVARDNVGYKSAGHGFFLEDGTEVFNILDRNLAVGARRTQRLPKQVLPFDQNEGAGFWWANSLNTFTRNVATNCGEYGFRFEATPSSSFNLTLPVQSSDGSVQKVDIRTLPFVRFDNNEVHSTEGLYGINLGEGVNRVGPDASHPFVVRNTTIWDIHYGFRPQVPSLLVENLTIDHFTYGVYHPNFDNHVYRNILLSNANAAEPFNRGHDDLSVQHGLLSVDGLTFDNVRSGGMPLIQISDDNATGLAQSHFRNVKVVNWSDNSKARAVVNLGGGPRPQPKSEKGVSIFLHDWFGEGQDAEVVSMRSPEYKANPSKYVQVKDLTGDESRAANVSQSEFPNLLHPTDDLHPSTVITFVKRAGDKLIVRGYSSDNGEIIKVTVNDKPVVPTLPDYSQWEVELASDTPKLTAVATDAAGNVEQVPHVLAVGL